MRNLAFRIRNLVGSFWNIWLADLNDIKKMRGE